MSGLSPAARAIVERGCRADGPSSADRARNRRAVLARIGATGAVAAGAAAATSAGAAAAPGASGAGAITTGATWGAGSLMAKAIVGVGLAAALSVGTARIPRMLREGLPPQAVAPTASAARTSVQGRATIEVTVPDVTVPDVTVPDVTVPDVMAQKLGASPEVDVFATAPITTPGARTPTPLPLVSAHAPKASGRAETSPSTLVEETALLRSANDALLGRDPARALGALDEYAKRFPHGALAEEHAGMRAMALCATAGADLDSPAAAAFLRAYPQSPLTARVRQECGSE